MGILNQLEDLELTRLVADRFRLDSGELRPCVANMLETRHGILDFKSEHIAYMIAIDLKHIDVDVERIKDILIEAGVSSISNIRSAIQSAKDDKYRRWACNSTTMTYELDQIRQYFCVGQERCLWYATHEGQGKKKFNRAEDQKYEKFGWHHICPGYEYILYMKIRELEQIHGVGTGGLIIANHDKLTYLVGCTRRHIGNAIKSLKEKELILYRVGDATRKERRASIIKRVIPIPEPDAKYECKLKEFEQYKRMGRID